MKRGAAYTSPPPAPHAGLAGTPGKALRFEATDKCLETSEDHSNGYNDDGRGGSSCVLSPPCMPGTVLRAFKVLSHGTHTMVPRDECIYHLHFTEEKTEV